MSSSGHEKKIWRVGGKAGRGAVRGPAAGHGAPKPLEGQSIRTADGKSGPAHSAAAQAEEKSEFTRSQLPDQPHLVQIGFDFGTSYSKCICRDLTTNRAWVHVPISTSDRKNPFLIPSAICVDDSRFIANATPNVQYPLNGLFHLKMALERVAREVWTDPALDAFKRQCGSEDIDVLRQYVMDANVYFLARALADVRRGLVSRFGDFGARADDAAYVNMAIPVADASSPAVIASFQAVLDQAWHIASSSSDLDAGTAAEQSALLRREFPAGDAAGFNPCFIYPEISANVQGFVRSRSARVGTYLFTDVGAGTVDQSTFVFVRRDDADWLTYLAARVLPLGSSQIERIAARLEEDETPANLEIWRSRKEKNEAHEAIDEARREIGVETEKGTYCTFGQTMAKLYVPEQLEAARLLFGGGGHCDDPYELAVVGQFGRRPWFIRDVDADVIGMPMPKDLELGPGAGAWIKRLSVAYGLSFFRGDLAGHSFPDDISNVKAGERQIRHDGVRRAPRKDDC